MPHPHPIVVLPDDADVLDLSVPPDRRPPRTSPFSVGRYDEDRVGVYTAARFSDDRTVHVGLDLGGPAGTPVHAFADGVVVHRGVDPGPGGFGGTVVTGHEVGGKPLYVLLGHLSLAGIRRLRPGDRFGRGDVLGHLGDADENGGWPPHVHVQCVRERPETFDLPGVVRPVDRAWALRSFPDPTPICGLPAPVLARLDPCRFAWGAR